VINRFRNLEFRIVS